MIILEFLGRLITAFIIEDLVFAGIDSLNNFVLKLRGIETLSVQEKKLKKLRKKYLFKKVKLLKTINPKIKACQIANVLEVVDSKLVYIEVIGPDKYQIEYKGDIAFLIKLNSIRLINT